MLARLSPDSARTKNAMANIVASQKVTRTAFDFFMILLLLCAPAFQISPCEPLLTLCGSALGMLRKSSQERQAELFLRKSHQGF
jgi:hypothetical protein